METTILSGDTIQMRQPKHADIPSLIAYASNIEIANNTFVPHPYTPNDARNFVKVAQEGWEGKTEYIFSIVKKGNQQFVGAMGIHPEAKHNLAEVGYWIGKPHWGNGYATQALRLIVQFGFEQIGLNRIQAGYFPHNPASGRVMEKVGMRYEGTFRQSMRHRRGYQDVIHYAILREDYDAQNS